MPRTRTPSKRASTRATPAKAAKSAKSAKKAKQKQTDDAPDHPLDQAHARIQQFVSAPEVFVTASDEHKEVLSQVLKSLFDFAKSQERTQLGLLPQLAIEGFDAEQIWGELELYNDPALEFFAQRLADIEQEDGDEDESDSDGADADAAGPDEGMDAGDQSDEDMVNPPADTDDDDAMDEDGAEEEEEEEEEDEGEGEGEGAITEEALKDSTAGPGKPAGASQHQIEDGFFKLSDLEKFSDFDFDTPDALRGLEEEELGEEEVGDAAELDGADIKYSDFFGGDNEAMDDDEDYSNGKPLSAYEKQQQAMKERIAELEDKIVKPRDWDQMGEVSSKQRPADSLLETNLEFDFIGSIPPPVTEETAMELEEVIKQRIIDEAFDDVERKLEPKEQPFKPRMELSDEKSKYGLAEIYEREYVQKATGTEEDAEVTSELAEKHKGIAKMFAQLCYKLDALSNFHFTPKPYIEEARVSTDAPAISIEEVLPMGVSQSLTQTPEETYRSATRGQVATQAELTQEERRAKRRLKKARHKLRTRTKEAELKAIAQSHPNSREAKQYEKMQMEKSIRTNKATTVVEGTDKTNYTRSKAFFTKLQDQIDLGKTKRGGNKSKGRPQKSGKPAEESATKPSHKYKL